MKLRRLFRKRVPQPTPREFVLSYAANGKFYVEVRDENGQSLVGIGESEAFYAMRNLSRVVSEFWVNDARPYYQQDREN